MTMRKIFEDGAKGIVDASFDADQYKAAMDAFY